IRVRNVTGVQTCALPISALVFRGHLLKFGGLQYVHPATQEIRFEEVTVRKPSIATADCFSDQKLAPSRHDCDDRLSVEGISSGLLCQNVVAWHSGERDFFGAEFVR